MKKITSLILLTCVLITSVITLASCIHECEFTDEWTADESSHWHICSNEKCEEISDKSNHTWDEGSITTKATQEADGVKTFTCSVCNNTKKESVAFTGLSKEDWNEIFSQETFENFTYFEEVVVAATGIEVTTSALYKFTEDKVYCSFSAAGQTAEDTLTGFEATNTKKQMVDSILSVVKHEIFEYDAENKIYNLTGEMVIESLSTSATSATLKFENGKPVQLIYTCNIVSQGIAMECISTTTFSDFGTTEI
nr:hypothetical protein [Oscillospiraceae bacterium]